MIAVRWFFKMFRNRFRIEADTASKDVHLRWLIAPGVVALEHEGGLVLLHTSTGQIFSCNRLGARIWRGLSDGLALDAVVQDLALGCGAGPHSTDCDVRQFLDSLQRNGIVRRDRGRRANSRTAAWLNLRALWSLTLYDITNALAGFRSVTWLVGRRRAECVRSDPEQVRWICDAVNLAACFYFKPVKCLQRASVIVRLLRKGGINGELVIGCRPSPFLAHAWAEVDGRVVGDSACYKQRLQVLHKV